MTLALVKKFFRETRALGLGSALRKTMRCVGKRSGLASFEQLEIVVSSRQQEEASCVSRWTRCTGHSECYSGLEP